MAGVVVVLGPSLEPSRLRELHVAATPTDDSIAGALQRLGANVRVDYLFADVDELVGDDEPQCLIVDAQHRPDLAASVLRHARACSALEAAPALVALPASHIQSYNPQSGFDDFIVLPCTPVEVYARLRQLEWNKSEFSTDERTKIGAIVIDLALHEVTVGGRAVTLTAREFALLAFFSQNRGRVLRRDVLLARVWGARYDGGARTVDIHVRRLRAKLGDALPLETLRGSGYLLRTPPREAGRAARLRVAK